MSPVIALNREISTTSVLMAEPPKKKKKMDIVILKMRHERKIRKLEKGIRKLKKTPKQLKPIEEYVLPPSILKALDVRTRDSQGTDEELMKLSKLWIAYKREEGRREKECLKKVVAAQDKALEVLKKESLSLYQKALEVDTSLLPLNDLDVVTETPANPEYTPPDGTKTDVSKVWSM